MIKKLLGPEGLGEEKSGARIAALQHWRGFQLDRVVRIAS
jgi:hypothetical protein